MSEKRLLILGSMLQSSNGAVTKVAAKHLRAFALKTTQEAHLTGAIC